MAAQPSVALVAVASGELYVRFARRMMVTASDHFKPTKNVALRVLKGKEGEWPTGTITRYATIMENEAELDFDYVFHVDADMRWLRRCDDSILSDGVTATLHPGYVGMPNDLLPYERNRASGSFVGAGEGTAYYAGGFIGGKRDAFLHMAEFIANGVNKDAASGVVSTWHDESWANRYLIFNPPAVTLTPRHCCPADSSWYRSALWPEDYSADAVLEALDKTADERNGR